jgi:integrase
MALTDKGVKGLVRRGEPAKHFDKDGLYLIVNGRNAAHWERRYELRGKAHWMGMGRFKAFGLEEARKRNKLVSQQLADGIDPLAAKRASRAAQAVAAAKTMTFRECAESYIAAHRDEWRNAKHGSQWQNTLATYAYPIIGSLPVAEIDTPLVLRVLEQRVSAERGYPAGPLWTARRETASRLRGRIESILGWATVRGYRKGDNPARWKDHLAEALPNGRQASRVEHHAALAYAELPGFIAALKTREGIAARALQFLILTAARTGEVIRARWTEIDFDEKIWTVPAGRMKGGREHRVALSPQAIALLNDMPREDGNPFIFIGSQRGEGLSNMSLTAVTRRMGQGDITVHGFRSTFRDWVAERTNYPSEVAEMALAHAVSDKVEAAYRRGDMLAKRHRLARDWAEYCESPPARIRADSTVVPMRGQPS